MNYPSLTLRGEYLEIVKCYKYLDLLLSSNLSWLTHIDSICVKVKKLLGLLHRQFSANTISRTLTKLYFSLIRPHLVYGAQVWNPYSSKHIQAIENVQKFVLQICSKKMEPTGKYFIYSNCHLWQIVDFTYLYQLFIKLFIYI